MWANAQRDGRPAEYRWRPLFNAAKFGSRPLLEYRAVTLIPAHFVPSQHVHATLAKTLYATNDTEIIVDGQVTTSISIQRRSFQSTFLLSSIVDKVILGSPCIRSFGISTLIALPPMATASRSHIRSIQHPAASVAA